MHVGVVGSRPVGLDAALAAHRGWRATLLGSAGGDCLAQVSPGVDSLRNPEPQFFVLGAKSYGRTSTFLLRVGFEQVDVVFASLADELLQPAG